MNLSRIVRLASLLTLLALQIVDANAETITAFSSWTLLEDPADPNFVGSSTATNASLSAIGGPIARGTDIGFGSTTGKTVAESTFGSFFDPGSDFAIAIDYSLSFGNSPDGYLGLGFGIGEEATGENSAGVSFLTQNGSPIFPFGGAARVNDVNQAPLVLGLTPTLSGSLFLDYEAATGNVTVGASQTAGDSTPTVFGTFVGIQDQWNGSGLVASFFIRSDGLIPGNQWNGGTADAQFSNFRILRGAASPVAVPEADGVWFLLGIGGLAAFYCARRTRLANPVALPFRV